MADANETQGHLHRISSTMNPSKNVSRKHPISSPLGIKTKSSRREEKDDVEEGEEEKDDDEEKDEESEEELLSAFPVTPPEAMNDSEDTLYRTSPWSPCSSFLSQEKPDITWDYSSPKHPEGVPGKERNIAIKDLTRALSETKKALRKNPHVVSPVSISTSSHSKLLEKWLSKDYVVNIPPNPPPKLPLRVKKSFEKKVSEDALMEMMKYLDSCANTGYRSNKSNKAKPKPETATAEENLQSTDVIVQETNSSDSIAKNELDLKAGVHTENDSSDELWGDDLTNESFVFEASEFSVNLENEMGNFSTEVATHGMVPVATDGSFVSEAMLYQKNCNNPKSDKTVAPFEEDIGAELSRYDVFDRSEKMNQKNLFRKKSVLSSKPCAQVSKRARSPLSHFSSSPCSFRGEESHIGISVDYAEGCPTENVCEQLPFSVSSVGKDKEKKYTFSKRMNSDSYLSKNKQLYNFCDSLSESSGLRMSSSQGAGAGYLRKEQSSQQSKSCFQNSTLTVQRNCDTTVAKDSANNVDSVFEAFDDPLVLEPEMWSWVNEVESQASSQVKCSPEEIALKKAAALKRRQKKQLLKQANK